MSRKPLAVLGLVALCGMVGCCGHPAATLTWVHHRPAVVVAAEMTGQMPSTKPIEQAFRAGEALGALYLQSRCPLCLVAGVVGQFGTVSALKAGDAEWQIIRMSHPLAEGESAEMFVQLAPTGKPFAAGIRPVPSQASSLKPQAPGP